MASPFIVTIAGKLRIQPMCVGGVVCIVGAGAMLLSKETLVKTSSKDDSEEPLLRQSTLEANTMNEEVNIRN